MVSRFVSRGRSASRGPKRLITVVVPADSENIEVVLAAVYTLACRFALQSVRQSRDGDWNAVARIADAMASVIEGMIEDQDAFESIERKAHGAAGKAARRHAELVPLVADLSAIIRGQ